MKDAVDLIVDTAVQCRPTDPWIERDAVVRDRLELPALLHESVDRRVRVRTAIGVQHPVRDLVHLEQDQLALQCPLRSSK
jgi:hypothetical protein